MTRGRAAPVRARLLNVVKSTCTDFNLVLVRFTLERLLYRLSTSAHADRFILKGRCASRAGMACRIEPYGMPTCSAR